MCEESSSPTTKEGIEPVDNPRPPAWLTVEVALYGLLAALALVVRVAELGRWPLLPEEVPTGLAAAEALRFESVEVRGYMPLLFDAQLLLLSSHTCPATVRLFTALVGSLLVLLPYRERAWLGRQGALAVATVMAFSPMWVYAGRTADGAVVSVGLGLLGLSLMRQIGPASRGWVAGAAGAALGLALAGGPQALSLLIPALLAGLYRWWGAPSLGRTAWTEQWRCTAARTLATSLLLAWFLAATTGLVMPGGLGNAVDVLGSWFGTLFASSALPLYQTPLVLAAYEPLVLLLGLLGIYRGVWGRRRGETVLAIWLLVALVFATLLGHRDARWMITVSVPLTLLAGRALQSMWDLRFFAHNRYDAIALGAAFCMAGLCYVELASYLQTLDATYLWLTLLGVGLVGAVLSGYAAWAGKLAASRVAVSLILAVALGLTIRGSVAQAYDRARDPWEPLLYGPTSGALPQFESFLQHVSLTQAGDPRAVDIRYEQSLGPHMAWLLREYPNARATVRIGEQSGATVLIGEPRAPEDAPLGYVGQSFSLREWPSADARSSVEIIKWLLYRQPGPEASPEQFWVWVKLEPGGDHGE